jgi:hypothetical protein
MARSISWFEGKRDVRSECEPWIRRQGRLRWLWLSEGV